MVGIRPIGLADIKTSSEIVFPDGKMGSDPVFPSPNSLTLWTTRTDILYICTRGGENQFRQLRVLLREWRDRAVGQTEGIIADQDLAVALRSGPDADGWNFQTGCDLRGEVVWYGFEHDREHAAL